MGGRAGIYIRLSVDRDGTAPSPARHERDCRKLCKERGWTVTKVYVDRDVSGYSAAAKRPGYDEMRSDLAARVIDAVVFWRFDRLTRQGIVAVGEFLRAIEQVGATFASFHEPYLDPSTPMGKGFIGLIGSMAEGESYAISLRVKSNHEDAARDGRPHMGGSRPFGFLPDRVTHDQAEAELLRDAADRFLAGASLRKIAGDLNDSGVRTPTGRGFQATVLSGMLRSPRLAGYREHRGELHPASWEPILDEDTWLRLQEAFKDSRRTSTRSQAVKHLLPGFVFCGVCGGRLKTMGFRMHNGKPFERYQCVRQPGQVNCGKVAVAKNSLDAWVTHVVLEHLADGDFSELESAGTTEDLDVVKRLVDDDKNALEELTRARYFDRTISDQEYASTRRLLVERIGENESLLVHALRDRRSGWLDLPKDRAGLIGWWDSAGNEDRRRVLALVLKQVTVHPAKRRGGNRFDTDRIEFGWR